MARPAVLLAAAVALAASSARADVLTIYGDAQLGGKYGKGLSGDPEVKDQAFFAKVPSFAYGGTIAARFLIFGASITHHQYTGGGDLATWTQLLAGLDFTVDLGSSEQKKARKGGFLHLSGGAGFGVGTGQQVDPPLDNAQISDKAVLLGGQIGFGKHLGKVVDAGISVPIGYGYFLKNGVPANDLSNHYQGVHVEVLAYLRLAIKFI
jgi:hypothetical protein